MLQPKYMYENVLLTHTYRYNIMRTDNTSVYSLRDGYYIVYMYICICVCEQDFVHARRRLFKRFVSDWLQAIEKCTLGTMEGNRKRFASYSLTILSIVANVIFSRFQSLPNPWSVDDAQDTHTINMNKIRHEVNNKTVKTHRYLQHYFAHTVLCLNSLLSKQ